MCIMEREIALKIKILLTLTMLSFLSVNLQAIDEEAIRDSTLQDIVVTGTRTAVPERAIVSTVSTVDSEQLNQLERISILPTLSEQVPSLFVTQRGLMGYGVSGGAAGGISVRGLNSGSGQAMILIDGHPQYQGIFGHSIADAYQTMVAERVEIVRGPASLFYGSNAMGGVINIVTRGSSVRRCGTTTNATVGVGSYGTVQAEASNQVRSGKFSSTVSAFSFSLSPTTSIYGTFCIWASRIFLPSFSSLVSISERIPQSMNLLYSSRA